MKILKVSWYDSNVLHGWQYGEYPAELALCTSIGFLKEETDTKMVLLQTISEYGAELGATVIAKGCIKSVKEMRVK